MYRLGNTEKPDFNSPKLITSWEAEIYRPARAGPGGNIPKVGRNPADENTFPLVAYRKNVLMDIIFTFPAI